MATTATTTTTTTAAFNADTPTLLSSISACCCSLLPVRIDVVSDDGSVRIFETMLWDPHCWPVSPLSSFRTLSAAVEANIQSVAHNLLADLEVQGMGRTQRHFTGRLDLWNLSLQTKIADQLRPQLLQMAHDYDHWNGAFVGQHVASTSKRLSWNNAAASDQQVIAPATTLSNDTTTTTAASAADNTVLLREIPIRLDVNGILIQDDVLWCDTSVTKTATTTSIPSNTTNCPIAISKSITQDLKLPDDAAVAICTSLVEQIHGNTVVPNTDATTTIPKVKRLDTSNNNNNNNKRQRISGAWSLESRDHLVKVNYVVAIHKPSSSSGSASTTNNATTPTKTTSSSTT